MISKRLQQYVSGFHVWPAGTSRPVERMPDGVATVVFRTGGHRDLIVAGAVTRAVYKHSSREDLVVAVDFRLGGAYPFLGVPMETLTDRMVSLDELWGDEGRALMDALLQCDDGKQVIERIEASLMTRLERAGDLELRSAVRVLRGVRRLVSEQPNIGVQGLASGVGLSERQLRRVFATAVGIGPKKYLQMLRFNRAIASTAMPGGQLALAAGYHDQAHLISEFQQLARMTPRAFANRHRVVS